MNIKTTDRDDSQKVLLQRISALCLLIVFYAAYATPARASGGIDKNWNFKVYLDDEHIGFHNFSIIHKEKYQEIYSSARFDVTFFFINAYSYKHDNVERWRGQCLDSINAVTDDNGDLYEVSGRAGSDAFIVNTAEERDEYPPCTKTFAYWDPEFLRETALLNSQTGELIDVESEFIGKESLMHKGEAVDARRYRLRGKDLQIDLWYSADDHWLALQSLTEGGRIIRYAMP